MYFFFLLNITSDVCSCYYTCCGYVNFRDLLNVLVDFLVYTWRIYEFIPSTHNELMTYV